MEQPFLVAEGHLTLSVCVGARGEASTHEDTGGLGAERGASRAGGSSCARRQLLPARSGSLQGRRRCLGASDGLASAAVHRDSRSLKAKALASLRRCARAFNDFDDDGRVCTVLLHLQHGFEMLLKASLIEKNVRVFDKRKGRSIGFDKSVSIGAEKLRLTDEQCGLLRAVDALRDDEQHFMGELSEGLLYLHVRAGVTLFAELLEKQFKERLADHLPNRVLPISTDPPADLDVLIDEQYGQIKKLLQPGKRRRADARAQIRALLAMEAHLAEEVSVTEKDVNRVEKAIKANRPRADVFPRLGGLGTSIEGSGVTIKVKFSKREGAPVRFIAADDPREAAAVREVDLQRKYRHSASDLARLTNLTLPRSMALRRELEIDGSDDYHHTFVFESQRISRYSDAALQKMREAMEAGIDMNEVWERHRPRRRRP